MINKIKWIFFLSLFIIMRADGQITLYPFNSPSAGDTNVYGVDTLPLAGFSPGLPGANQTYDYTALVNHYNDTVFFIDPMQTPYGPDYPLANLVRYDQDDTAMQYWHVDTNKIDIVGILDDSYSPGYVLPYHYDPFRLNLTYPSTYNTYHPNSLSIIDITVPGASVGEPYDSVRRKLIDLRTIIFDGWGTLILASGSYPCLRESRQDAFTDSIWSKTNPGNWVLIKHDTKQRATVRYYTNISNDPMLRIKYNQNLVVTNVFFLINPTLFTGVEQKELSVQARVFPNPASDELFVLHNTGKGNSIEIYDMAGNKVLGMRLDENVQRINCSHLVAGQYVAKIICKSNQTLTTQFLVEK